MNSGADFLPWLVAASVACGVLGVGWLAYAYLLDAQRKLRRQRQFAHLEQRLLAPGSPPAVAAESEELGALERSLLSLLGHLPSGGLNDQDSEDRRLLVQAGFRGASSVLTYQLLRWSALLFLVLLAAGRALYSGGDGNTWLQALAVAIVAWLLPRYLLRYLAARRLRQLAEELPVFIDFLRMMHSVGISFEQSINIFAQNPGLGLPILSAELAAVALAIRSGRSRTEALQLMAHQLDVDDLSELVALICHTDYYGAGVQEPLRQFSLRLTERKRFQMQEYVGKLATRMVVVMVLFLLPALIIVTAGPGFVAVFKALEGMS